MTNLHKITEADVSNKKVIVRGDLDVGKVNENDLRLKSLVPTLKYLLEHEAKVILIGHRGRPEGKVNNEFSLKPVEEVLKKMLQRDDFEVLENLRFDPREEVNDDDYAKELASLGDIYVNEAFSVCHREHTSIVGIPKYLPHYAGINLSNEIENLSKVTNSPERPLVILISGVKKDKLEMIEPLSNLADKVLVGGRLPDFLGDNTVSVRSQNGKVIIGNLVMDKEDITVNTIEKFKEEIGKAKTIVLAGVLGRYEDEGHSQGTRAVFEAVGDAPAVFKIVGGGDSLAAITKYNLVEKFNWISVGGGAMLDFLTKKSLPGIDALLK